jgi:hypothetical protein
MARINRNSEVAGRPAVAAVPAVPETFDLVGLTRTQAQMLRALVGRAKNVELVEVSQRLREAVQYDWARTSYGHLNILVDGQTHKKDFGSKNIEVVLTPGC